MSTNSAALSTRTSSDFGRPYSSLGSASSNKLNTGAMASVPVTAPVTMTPHLDTLPTEILLEIVSNATVSASIQLLQVNCSSVWSVRMNWH